MAFGCARRATARDLGLGLGVVVAAEACEELGGGVVARPWAAGSAMRPTALGVGVAGVGRKGFWERLLGVDGASLVLAAGEVFLLRDWVGGAGAGGGGMAEAWALRRADLRPDIVKCAVSVGFDGSGKGESGTETGRWAAEMNVQSF